jgi:hypothetical protein
MTRDAYFFANGPARLLMSAVIANELYPEHRRHLILLHQYGYRYDALLPALRPEFDRVYHLTIRARHYSPLDQFVNCYCNPYPRLRRFFTRNADVVLFGIRSPVQKFIVRHNRRLGNRIEVFAESLAVDRYFAPAPPRARVREAIIQLFPRAFAFQHDYDRFHVPVPELYQHAPMSAKLHRMFNLYGSPSYRRYAERFTAGIDLEPLRDFTTIFLGQPLSNFEQLLAPAEEERMLAAILGDRRVLVLPHPNERLEPGRDKYRVLPRAVVFRSPVPSEMLLQVLRPATTVTYYSTAGVNYAMANDASTNYFYPIHRSHWRLLSALQSSISNLVVSDEHVIGEDPHVMPRRMGDRA